MLSYVNHNANTLQLKIQVQNFYINGDSVVIIQVLIVQYVIKYVLVFNHIYVYGVVVQDMVYVMMINYNVILVV